MKADRTTQLEIESVIDRFTDAYSRRDLDALTSSFVPDDDIVMYGTGQDERRVGTEQIQLQAKRDWDQTDEVVMRFDSREVWAKGDVAWAALDGAFELSAGGESMTLPARVSLVFEKRDGQWQVVHGHFSTPAAGQEEGESF